MVEVEALLVINSAVGGGSFWFIWEVLLLPVDSSQFLFSQFYKNEVYVSMLHAGPPFFLVSLVC